ncbi:MAG: hypothetical protein WB973_08985 [Thermoanaerobaculia bacterium]
MTDLDLAQVTHEYFESLLEQSFEVTTDDQTLALRVTGVRMLPPPKRKTLTGTMIDVATPRLPFTVFFRSEGEMGLRQGTYSMTPPHDRATINIFLVPLGFEDGGVVYEAVFS